MHLGKHKLIKHLNKLKKEDGPIPLLGVEMGYRNDYLEEINDILNSSKSENAAYIEKTAREDLDYAYKDERIFINISGE